MNNSQNLVNLFNEAISAKNAELFITTVQPVVAKYAQQFCKNPNDFEDICQEVYLELCERIAKGKKMEPTKSSFFNLFIMDVAESVSKRYEGRNDISLSDIQHECDFSFDKAISNSMQKEALKKALAISSEREREVISYHFGLEDNIPKTLNETGKHFGMSGKNVSRIEKKTFKRLRNAKNRKLISDCI